MPAGYEKAGEATRSAQSLDSIGVCRYGSITRLDQVNGEWRCAAGYLGSAIAECFANSPAVATAFHGNLQLHRHRCESELCCYAKNAIKTRSRRRAGPQPLVSDPGRLDLQQQHKNSCLRGEQLSHILQKFTAWLFRRRSDVTGAVLRSM